ncbi:rhodanese-related sulfurtransferase [Romboutsia weinsteinii]|uniref:tRNA uridine(34) hydroxylase n=1 Tax=Romboutsia weinsteinii TaxID=2020949 RepID=A0A371IXB7_9FIRM|nr:rhodanese-related sulfurtransferase [Romboutsia weinsteinii]RDY25124.1 rhodanese-related sulfurtransferase [Romboutsia weinsteinii]
MNKNYRILLYYKFINIENPEEFKNDHLALCKELNLKGRILISHEGINGTCSGTVEDTEKYMEILKSYPGFSDTVFKIDESENHIFNKLHVKHKSILTLLPEDEVNPNDIVGTYLKPKEFYEMLQRDDVIIVDGRNDYEYEIGHFRGAIKPDVQNFKQFPEWIDKTLGDKKDKKILSYCTGGIRCEKLTGVFLNKGFNEVYHLDGGIVTYGKDEDVKGKLWDGKCYVFDNRISVQINRTEEDIVISKCSICGVPSDRYINCRNDDCHDQFICCESCEDTYAGFCSTDCSEHVIKKPERDSRFRLMNKKELYEKYNQDHDMYKHVIEKLKK